MCVQGTKEKHDKKDWRENNLGARHIQHHPIKPRTEFKNGLRVTLHVVEKRHERAERIRYRVRASMLVQDSEHFKTLAVVQSTLVIKKEPKRTLADSRPNLPFPEKTRRDIGRSCDQQRLTRAGYRIWADGANRESCHKHPSMLLDP